MNSGFFLVQNRPLNGPTDVEGHLQTMLPMFYTSVVAIVVLYATVCWGSLVKAVDGNRLNKLIEKAGSTPQHLGQSIQA